MDQHEGITLSVLLDEKAGAIDLDLLSQCRCSYRHRIPSILTPCIATLECMVTHWNDQLRDSEKRRHEVFAPSFGPRAYAGGAKSLINPCCMAKRAARARFETPILA